MIPPTSSASPRFSGVWLGRRSNPSLFGAAFLLNEWLLGYHHVISTFTRLTFDKDSFNEHRFLVTWLPLLVLSAVVLAASHLEGGY